MNFNLRTLVAAAAVATASFGAVAAPIPVGLNPGTTAVTGYGTTFGPVTFSYSFTLDSLTNFSSLSGSLAVTDASALSVSLVGPTSASTTFAAIPGIPGSFSFGSLADGAYVLSFLATPSSSSFAAYGGFITSAAIPAVPEPQSIAMMLAGLGVAGVLVRRRKA